MKVLFGRYGVVFYTGLLVPDKFGGVTLGPFIFICPKYLCDRGLLEHELMHTRQIWRGLIIVPCLRYWLSKKWRLEYEVEAYREQMKWYHDDRSAKFATSISTKYGLDVTYEAALALLLEV